ncbi:hypothetical protein BS47DRAFT_109879 [Hydnum rufescens UP504]|uniref:Uncharacterized protein n=1 Tax=Hydnum rufescens UP504 TaxID=1448309 RepID=A0A9P6DPF5_9AGAM|nr:hypothetical protein BS47DRAFT_109879 [Hydnum rufescens UP504]
MDQHADTHSFITTLLRGTYPEFLHPPQSRGGPLSSTGSSISGRAFFVLLASHAVIIVQTICTTYPPFYRGRRTLCSARSHSWPKTKAKLIFQSRGYDRCNNIRGRVSCEKTNIWEAGRKAFESRGERAPRREDLYSAFNRYRCKGPWFLDGLTFVVTNAIRFPKEVRTLPHFHTSSLRMGSLTVPLRVCVDMGAYIF